MDDVGRSYRAEREKRRNKIICRQRIKFIDFEFDLTYEFNYDNLKIEFIWIINMDKINLQFKLPVSVIREGKKYIAYTPVLDLSTSANNFESAKKRFGEIVCIFFEELIKKGTLEDVLRDLGWKKIQKNWNPPVVVSQEFHTVCFKE